MRIIRLFLLLVLILSGSIAQTTDSSVQSDPETSSTITEPSSQITSSSTTEQTTESSTIIETTTSSESQNDQTQSSTSSTSIDESTNLSTTTTTVVETQPSNTSGESTTANNNAQTTDSISSSSQELTNDTLLITITMSPVTKKWEDGEDQSSGSDEGGIDGILIMAIVIGAVGGLTLCIICLVITRCYFTKRKKNSKTTNEVTMDAVQRQRIESTNIAEIVSRTQITNSKLSSSIKQPRLSRAISHFSIDASVAYDSDEDEGKPKNSVMINHKSIVAPRQGRTSTLLRDKKTKDADLFNSSGDEGSSEDVKTEEQSSGEDTEPSSPVIPNVALDQLSTFNLKEAELKKAASDLEKYKLSAVSSVATLEENVRNSLENSEKKEEKVPLTPKTERNRTVSTGTATDDEGRVLLKESPKTPFVKQRSARKVRGSNRTSEDPEKDK